MKANFKLNSLLVNRILLGFIGLLVILTLFGANLVVGKLRNQGDTLVSLKAKQQALTQEKANLVTAKAEVKKYAELETIAQAVVPQDKDQAEAVREIVNLAQANGITLTTVSFPYSTLGLITGSTPTSTTTPSSLSLSQLTAVKGIPGVYSLPITIEDNSNSTAVSYTAFYNFLTSLEQNRRTSLVTGLNIQPLPNGLVTFSLNVNEYIKPQ
jgi:hypothetical protein